MRIQRQMVGFLLIPCLALALATPAAAQKSSGSAPENPSASTSDSTKPDNTKMNRAEQPTADQQKETKTDRELSRRIRRAITQDKNMSTYARNVKIVAEGGKVTLKGPVRSEEEKQAVEDKATEVAGQGNVTSEIRIAPKKG
jgi:hyperosmotically inducible periplasmic protein